jgi:hypothetical protein
MDPGRIRFESMSRNYMTIGAVAIVVAMAGAYRLGEAAQTAVEEHQKSGLVLNGDAALWTVAIKPDKTADFEKVLARVRDALQQSTKPERKQQAAGWRVLKVDKPLPDGTIAYIHIITPVANADYTLLKMIYEEFPSESQQMYETYRAAFVKNLALASGSVVMDMSKPTP